MSGFNEIQQKLEFFIKKYYTNELIKGAIFFFSIGLLYFIATVFIEYFLWLGKAGRTLLFWLFIFVELGLLIRFIIFPLAKLLKFKHGINYKEASLIIGNHFPEVSDKLINILQLAENKEKSELLLASIEHKSLQISPIPFNLAINFKHNISYIKYAILPVLIILVVWISGNNKIFTTGYKRVVNYNVAYEPPAPFEFLITNNELKAIQNKPFELNVKTIGDYTPEEVEIYIDDENYFLQNTEANSFRHIFTETDRTIRFYLKSNGVRSKTYSIDIIEVPSLVNFEMVLDYPGYTGKKDEVLKSTGNAVVPEGTKVNWNVLTKSANSVDLLLSDTLYSFNQYEALFKFGKTLYNDLTYEITTSNKDLAYYERLGFSIDVVKDKYPEIEIMAQNDTLSVEKDLYLLGQISDDYGLSSVKMFYYPSGDETIKKEIDIPIKKGTFDRFNYVFPLDLELEGGLAYEFYFEVTDNDAINNGKKSKSKIFSYRKLTDSEQQDERLEKQNEAIKGLDKSLDKLRSQQKELENISKNQKEKGRLNFNDQKKLKNFLSRQKQQEQLIKNFTNELQKNLEEFDNGKEEKDEFSELLEERLEREKKQLEKNERLLKELEKITDKLSKEELSERIEKLAKRQQNSKRSIEQILELTKRYYVTAKASKLQQDLEKLSEQQKELSEQQEENNTLEKQKELSNSFEDLKKELESLEKANQELKKPLDLDRDQETEKEVDKAQREAEEKLDDKEQNNTNQNDNSKRKNDAKQKQKKASEKLKELSENLKQQIQQGGEEGDQEDAESLRQILDNLVLFSFDQEATLDKFSNIDNASASFASELRKQNDLKDLFRHIDDSLFALSLRRPELSEQVNREITDVYYNIDKALDRLAQNRIDQGVSSQQYALTAANNLADFLSDVLDQIQQSLNGSASSQGDGGQGFQLPDIIQTQEQINQQFKKGLGEQQGSQGEQGQQEGQQGQEGAEGQQQGQAGQEGGQGENGSNGENGKGEQNGANGKQNGGKGNGEGSFGDEQWSEQLYEIYKKQEQLRLALEEQLKDQYGKGLPAEIQKILDKAEEAENDLLENGFSNENLNKLLELKHQLLKLDKAAFEQGRKKERESRTNYNTFNNRVKDQLLKSEQFFKQVEILNRQSLPLRQIYKKKVQTYFKGND